MDFMWVLGKHCCKLTRLGDESKPCDPCCVWPLTTELPTCNRSAVKCSSASAAPMTVGICIFILQLQLKTQLSSRCQLVITHKIMDSAIIEI